jgi:protein subunit release factor A
VVTAEDSRSQWTNLQSAKTKLESLLLKQKRQEAELRVTSERNEQIAAAERSAKNWTHNDQRNEIVCHETGQHWHWTDFYGGRIG